MLLIEDKSRGDITNTVNMNISLFNGNLYKKKYAYRETKHIQMSHDVFNYGCVKSNICL